MAQPPAEWWQTLLSWLKDNVLIFMVFGLLWKGIDKVFKYFSESRDSEIRKIVKDEITPLEDKIDALGEAIWDMKTHK